MDAQLLARQTRSARTPIIGAQSVQSHGSATMRTGNHARAKQVVVDDIAQTRYKHSISIIPLGFNY